MKRHLAFLFTIISLCLPCMAQHIIHQEVEMPFNTPLGVVELVRDYNERGHDQSVAYLLLNKKPLLRGKMLDGYDASLQLESVHSIKSDGKEIDIRILFREVYPAGGDAGWEKYYIVDLTGKEPVISPGFDNGDMTYVKKVVWSNDKVIITFRDRGKVFLWKDFRLTEVKKQNR